MRDVAFNDDAVLSGGWFRDKDERVNAEKASRENATRKKQKRSKGRSFIPCLFQASIKEEEEAVEVERRFAIAGNLSQAEEKNWKLKI